MAQMSHDIGDRPRGKGNITSVEAWSYAQQVLLVAVFAAASFFRPGTEQFIWPQGWISVFVSLGMLCLGFGAATLFYRRRQQAESASLRSDIAELKTRARTLGAEMDEYLERRQPPGVS